MENRLNFNDPQKWVSDSKELVLDTTKRFEFNVEIYLITKMLSYTLIQLS